MNAALLSDWGVQSVAGGNAILAWAAGMTHVWAAFHTSGWLRKMFVTIATLALFYSFAYWWLFANPDRGSDWSEFLRPFGIVTWIVAWSIEPVILVVYLKRRAAEIEMRAERAVREAKQKYGMD